LLLRGAPVVERLARLLRLRERLEQFLALARDLRPPRLQLGGLGGELLTASGEILPAALEVDEVRPVTGKPGQDGDGVMPLLLHRPLRGMDPFQGDRQFALEQRAARLVLGPGVGELAQILLVALLLPGEKREAGAE